MLAAPGIATTQADRVPGTGCGTTTLSPIQRSVSGPVNGSPFAAVATSVTGYLARHPDAAARWSGLQVLEADSPDGRTVRVRLAAVVRPAWTAWVLAPFTDGIAIGAWSEARAW